MKIFFDNLQSTLDWIGESPFRLFTVLAIGLLVTMFVFFRKEAPQYKMAIIIVAIISITIIAWFPVLNDMRSNSDEVITEKPQEIPKSSAGGIVIKFSKEKPTSHGVPLKFSKGDKKELDGTETINSKSE